MSQIRRASVSIVYSLSKGAARKTIVERKRFYQIARSSLVELDTQFEVCIEIGYINFEELSDIQDLLNHLFAMLTNLMNKIK